MTIEIKAKVLNRQMLTDNIMELTIETYQEVEVIPGQWALFLFEDEQGPFQRCYSIVEHDTDNEKTMLIFAIKLSDNGRGSMALRKIRIGDEIRIMGVFGNFILQNTKFPKTFIGTGTGIAPLINMAKHCMTQKYLLFSVSYEKDLFYQERIRKISDLKYDIYVSQESVPGYQSGRIDIAKYHFDPTTEFYVCGKPEIVQDIVSKLTTLGYTSIYTEKF